MTRSSSGTTRTDPDSLSRTEHRFCHPVPIPGTGFSFCFAARFRCAPGGFSVRAGRFSRARRAVFPECQAVFPECRAVFSEVPGGFSGVPGETVFSRSLRALFRRLYVFFAGESRNFCVARRPFFCDTVWRLPDFFRFFRCPPGGVFCILRITVMQNAEEAPSFATAKAIAPERVAVSSPERMFFFAEGDREMTENGKFPAFFRDKRCKYGNNTDDF